MTALSKHPGIHAPDPLSSRPAASQHPLESRPSWSQPVLAAMAPHRPGMHPCRGAAGNMTIQELGSIQGRSRGQQDGQRQKTFHLPVLGGKRERGRLCRATSPHTLRAVDASSCDSTSSSYSPSWIIVGPSTRYSPQSVPGAVSSARTIPFPVYNPDGTCHPYGPADTPDAVVEQHQTHQTFLISPSASTSSFSSISSASCERAGCHESDVEMPGKMTASGESKSAGTNFFTTTAARSESIQWPPSPIRNASAARPAGPRFRQWARMDKHASSRGALDTMGSPKTNNDTRALASSHARDPSSPPRLTREEFEALPPAIQRKYFSTLERLRFARDCGLDGICQHYDNISNLKHSGHGHLSVDRLHCARQPSPTSHSGFPDTELTLFYTNLPEKIKKRHFTREEQLALARNLRASVILDAADEAMYKFSRGPSRNAAFEDVSEDETLAPSPLPPGRDSMDSFKSCRESSGSDQGPKAKDALQDTFRWLDEEEDLNLKLILDGYEFETPQEATLENKEQRSSSEGHLAVAASLSFERVPTPSARPVTKDTTSPLFSPVESIASTNTFSKRRSRAMSLLVPTSRHGREELPTSMDHAAAHYQDPEARLKLRVYLASPQKFDEAVEFGFPSADVLATPPPVTKDGKLDKRNLPEKLSISSSNFRSFLADEDEDEDDDQESLSISSSVSLADPDSPKTPQAVDNDLEFRRPAHVSTDQMSSQETGQAWKLSDGLSYAHMPASSREMTLRMTLTRPDLRASEDQMYGWQQQPPTATSKRGYTSKSMEGTLSGTHSGTFMADGFHNRKAGHDHGLGSIDHWSPAASEKGRMRRFWSRVRRS